MCLFSMGTGAIVTSVMFTLWLLFLRKAEFPRRREDVVRGIRLMCPHSFHVFSSSGEVLTPVRIGDWHSYLFILSCFWEKPRMEVSITHFPCWPYKGHGRAWCWPAAYCQHPGIGVEGSPYRLYIKGNSFSWVKVQIFPLELGNHPFLSSRDKTMLGSSLKFAMTEDPRIWQTLLSHWTVIQ